MLSYEIGISALRSSQFALDTISNNIANASNPNYHRQNVVLESRSPTNLSGYLFGTGVSITNIRQARNFVIESSITTNISEISASSQHLDAMKRIESHFSIGDGSLHTKLDSLFTSIQELSANPGETSQKRIAVRDAQQLATEIHTVHQELTELKSSIKQEIESEVQSVNESLEQFVELEKRIRNEINLGRSPNSLIDQRDQLVNEIAELIDVKRPNSSVNEFGISVGDHSLLLQSSSIEIQTATDSDGNIQLNIQGRDKLLNFSGGRIHGLVESYNDTITDFQSKLDEFAEALISEFDSVHSTGVGDGGGFSRLDGSRSFSNPSHLLSEAFDFPPESGSLFVSVVDEATGQKKIHEIQIDPETQTVKDFELAIDGIDNIQGRIDTQTNTFKIYAASGYTVDFAGQVETDLDLTSFTGTSTPVIQGQYNGNRNRNLNIDIVGTGTVGESDPLFVRVLDEDGLIVSEQNIGVGYEAGSPLEVIDDVTVSFGVGDVAAGDSFSIDLIADPDESGILVSLGINSFFSGSSAGDIGVSDHLLENPDNLSISKSGEIGDTRNIDRFFDIREKQFDSLNQTSLNEYLSSTSVEIGSQVEITTRAVFQFSAVQNQLENEKAGTSGVDPNEELIRLNQFQQSFEAAVRVLSAIDQTLDDLFTLVR